MTSTERLRYTGKHPKVFMDHGIGELEEGGEFEVPTEDAERFTRREDVEPAAKGKAKTAPKAGADEGGKD